MNDLEDLNHWIGQQKVLTVPKASHGQYVFSQRLANEYRKALIGGLLATIEDRFGPEYDLSENGSFGFPHYESNADTPFSDAVLVYFVGSTSKPPNPFLLGGSVPTSYFYKGRRWSDSRLTRRFYVGFNLLKAHLRHPDSPIDSYFAAFPEATEIVLDLKRRNKHATGHLTATVHKNRVNVALDPDYGDTAGPVHQLWQAVTELKRHIEGHDIHPEVMDARTLDLLKPIQALGLAAAVASEHPALQASATTAMFGLCAYYDWPFRIRLYRSGDARVVITYHGTEPTASQIQALRDFVRELSNCWTQVREREPKATALARGRGNAFLAHFRRAYSNMFRPKFALMGKCVAEAVKTATADFRWAMDADSRLEAASRPKDLESLCDRLADRLVRDPDFGEQLAKTDGQPEALLKLADLHLGDLIGVRVVVATEVEVLRIASLLFCRPLRLSEADVWPDPSRRKGLLRREASMWASGYRSVHLQYNVDASRFRLPLNTVRVELQIRSRLAHVWSELEHQVRYKGGIALPLLEKDWKQHSRAADNYHLGEDASAVLSAFVATAHGLHQQDREFRYMALAYERLRARYGPAIGRGV